jgi:hypothetical protein
MNLRTCFGKRGNDQSMSFSNLNNSQDQNSPSPKSNSLHLRYIFRNIIVKGDSRKEKFVLDEPKEDFYVSRLDQTIMRRNHETDAEDDANSQVEMAAEILQSFGDKLIDILCHDCTGRHDVVKMLAFACIDLLLDIDNMTQFIHFVSSRGYLVHIIDSLLKTIVKLCHVLDNQLNPGLLQELSAITGLIARPANQYISDLIDPNGNHDVSAHLYRLQKLMMTLFTRFTISDANMKEIIRMESNSSMMMQVDGVNESGEKQKTERLKVFLQIAANLSLYARNCIANHSVDHRTAKVLFTVSGDGFNHRRESTTIETLPDLNIVVSQLKNCVEIYNREKFSYDNLPRFESRSTTSAAN